MSMPDPLENKVRIPIRVKNGRVVPLDGDLLPKIRNDAVGELILGAYAVEDQENPQVLQVEQVSELLPKGESVFLGVSPSVIRPERIHQLIKPSDLRISSKFLFTEVRLQEPQMLRTGKTKNPALEPCPCYILVLQQEARSLNHAFTLISTEFETRRISHTGNVFQRGFVKQGDKWISLNKLRRTT